MDCIVALGTEAASGTSTDCKRGLFEGHRDRRDFLNDFRNKMGLLHVLRNWRGLCSGFLKGCSLCKHPRNRSKPCHGFMNRAGLLSSIGDTNASLLAAETGEASLDTVLLASLVTGVTYPASSRTGTTWPRSSGTRVACVVSSRTGVAFGGD